MQGRKTKDYRPKIYEALICPYHKMCWGWDWECIPALLSCGHTICLEELKASWIMAAGHKCYYICAKDNKQCNFSFDFFRRGYKVCDN